MAVAERYLCQRARSASSCEVSAKVCHCRSVETNGGMEAIATRVEAIARRLDPRLWRGGHGLQMLVALGESGMRVWGAGRESEPGSIHLDKGPSVFAVFGERAKVKDVTSTHTQRERSA